MGLVIGGACLVCGAAPAAAASYDFVPVDAVAADLIGTVVVGINDTGDISGYYVTGSGAALDYHGFTGQAAGGTLTEVVRPGSFGTSVTTINNDRTLVGVSIDTAGHGFKRTPAGQFVTVDPPAGGYGPAYTEAVGISNDGAIVGYYTEEVPPSADAIQPLSHGFLLIGKKYSRIEVPASWGYGTQPYTVNIHHLVVGSYLDNYGIPHGFSYMPRHARRKLDLPFAAASEPGGSNDAGDVAEVALSPDPSSPIGYHADGYIIHNYDDDRGLGSNPDITPIAYPGATSTQPFSINNLGQVVGLYVDSGNRIHGFVASPK